MKTKTKTKKTETKKAVAKKQAKAAPVAEKLSQIAAAERVLAEAGEPMTCKAMVEAMSAKGLWTSPAGKSPNATLYASILRELAKKGKDARFTKAAPGRFAARA